MNDCVILLFILMMICIFKSFELFEGECLKDVPFAFVEFVLEFYPMQPQ